MRHHLRTIMSYTQQGKYQEMMEYLQEYASVITEEEKRICYCRNMAVDAVIHFYAGELRKKGIPVSYTHLECVFRRLQSLEWIRSPFSQEAFRYLQKNP